MAKGSTMIETTTTVNPLIHKRGGKTPVNINSIHAMKPEDDYKVRGQFVNVEYPGEPQKISGIYYKGMPYFCETLKDGETTTVPLSVARWINEEFGHQQATNLLDDKGNPIKGSKKIPRGKFIIEEHLK